MEACSGPLPKVTNGEATCRREKSIINRTNIVKKKLYFVLNHCIFFNLTQLFCDLNLTKQQPQNSEPPKQSENASSIKDVALF